MRLTEAIDFLTRPEVNREAPYTHLCIRDENGDLLPELGQLRRRVRKQLQGHTQLELGV